MRQTTQPHTALGGYFVSCASILLLSLLMGCANISTETKERGTWVPASAEIKQSLGVSTWYIETMDGGTLRVAGFDQSERLLSELQISEPILNQGQAVVYELHVSLYTRLVFTEQGVIENTISTEPRGLEWFEAMFDVQKSNHTGSSVDKALINLPLVYCVGQSATEIINLACDLYNGSLGSSSVTDAYKACAEIRDCFKQLSSNNQQQGTQLACNNTGTLSDASNDPCSTNGANPSDGNDSGWTTQGNDQNNTNTESGDTGTQPGSGDSSSSDSYDPNADDWSDSGSGNGSDSSGNGSGDGYDPYDPNADDWDNSGSGDGSDSSGNGSDDGYDPYDPNADDWDDSGSGDGSDSSGSDDDWGDGDGF